MIEQYRMVSWIRVFRESTGLIWKNVAFGSGMGFPMINLRESNLGQSWSPAPEKNKRP